LQGADHSEVRIKHLSVSCEQSAISKIGRKF
jgi:hypothetical protein